MFLDHIYKNLEAIIYDILINYKDNFLMNVYVLKYQINCFISLKILRFLIQTSFKLMLKTLIKLFIEEQT